MRVMRESALFDGNGAFPVMLGRADLAGNSLASHSAYPLPTDQSRPCNRSRRRQIAMCSQRQSITYQFGWEWEHGRSHLQQQISSSLSQSDDRYAKHCTQYTYLANIFASVVIPLSKHYNTKVYKVCT